MGDDQRQHTFCSECGVRNLATNSFCIGCGRRLAALPALATEQEQVAKPPLPSRPEVPPTTSAPLAQPSTEIEPQQPKSRVVLLIGGALAALLVVLGVVGFLILRPQGSAEIAQPTPAPPPSGGWSPDPSMLNGTVPAVIPTQCLADGAATPSLKLTNGHASIPGTTYGKYDLVGTPLKGRFVAGEPEYTAFAFTCIGDGNYKFVELVVIGADGQQLATTPATTEDAIRPVAEKFEPEKSISASGPSTFEATGAGPTLAGTWSAHNGGTFKAKVQVAQSAEAAPITQVATALSKSLPSPAISQGLSYFSPEKKNTGEGTFLLKRTGNNIIYQQGYSGGINCFNGRIVGSRFVGTLSEFGEVERPTSTEQVSTPFEMHSDELSFADSVYLLESPDGTSFDPRCQ